MQIRVMVNFHIGFFVDLAASEAGGYADKNGEDYKTKADDDENAIDLEIAAQVVEALVGFNVVHVVHALGRCHGEAIEEIIDEDTDHYR
jgi:hypothetical protein